MSIDKLRNEDLSVYFFVKNLLVGKVSNILDSYPYNEIESDTLSVPSVSVEHTLTQDDPMGELGASWYNRNWAVNVFAKNDTQRDEIAGIIFDGLGNALKISDYSGGYNIDTGLSRAGATLRIIEYGEVNERVMKPIYSFDALARIKYWRMTLTFSTVSTDAS